MRDALPIYVTERRPAGSVELVVDAARDFGSGSHATTARCLRALQDTIRRDRPRRILDLGCGSGILAMAAAKLVPTAQVVAVNLDPVSVATARENTRLNRTAGTARTGVSRGWQPRPVGGRGHHHLWLATTPSRRFERQGAG